MQGAGLTCVGGAQDETEKEMPNENNLATDCHGVLVHAGQHGREAPVETVEKQGLATFETLVIEGAFGSEQQSQVAAQDA